jgi:hypothetical protein
VLPPPLLVVDEGIAGQTTDGRGARVALLARVWHGKILVDHREMAWWLREVLATVAAPDHVEPDPEHPDRLRCFARGLGPPAAGCSSS